MHERKRIKAALLGLGTVGGGVYKLAERQKNEMEQKAGAELEIAKILVRDKEKVREGVRTELLTDNWTEILEDPQIEIVLSLIHIFFRGGESLSFCHGRISGWIQTYSGYRRRQGKG